MALYRVDLPCVQFSDSESEAFLKLVLTGKINVQINVGREFLKNMKNGKIFVHH